MPRGKLKTNSGGRTPLNPTEKTIRRSFCLPESLDERIMRRAAREVNLVTGSKKSWGEIVRDALEFYLDTIERRKTRPRIVSAELQTRQN